MQGIVDWFNSQKGYGFLKTEDGKDVFFHHSNIIMDGFRTLDENDIVIFEFGVSNDGREQAVNVTPIVTTKMIEDVLMEEDLYLSTMKDAYGVKKYLVVDMNNVLQSQEQGMYFLDLAAYAGIDVEGLV